MGHIWRRLFELCYEPPYQQPLSTHDSVSKTTNYATDDWWCRLVCLHWNDLIKEICVRLRGIWPNLIQ